MSNFRPRFIEIFYNANHVPVTVRASGETIEATGVMTNASVDYPLSGADQTNLQTILGNIKTAKGR